MRTLPLCLLTVSLTALPGVAVADPIQIFLDGRNVFAAVVTQNNSDQLLNDRHQLFGEPLASAAVVSPDGYIASALTTLSSSVTDPHHLFGAGTGSASATVPSTNRTGVSAANSESTFSVGFFLDRQHAFDFSGVFTGTDSLVEAGNVSSRVWVASLVSITADSIIFDHRRVLASGTDQLRETGLLPFGDIMLTINGNVDEQLHQPGSTHASHDEFAFRFDLAQTPEPTSLVLLGSGVMGLLTAKRRKVVLVKQGLPTMVAHRRQR